MAYSVSLRQFLKYIALFLLTSSLLISWGCISPSNSQTLPNYNSPMGGNLDFPGDWSEEYPFIDLLKNSRNWIPVCPQYDNSCFPNQEKPKDEGLSLVQMDEQGWLTSLQAKDNPDVTFANVQTIFLSLDPEQPLPEKRFYVFYEGEGTLEYALSVKKNQELSQPGRDVIEISKDDGYGSLRIKETDPQNTGNYLRNIRIIRADHLDEYEAGETTFNPDFLKHIENYKSLRFMDWMLTNSSEEQEWRDRPKPDQISYLNHYVPDKGKIRGYPIEVMTELSNRVQAYPWFNIPHEANDEYIREFAKLVKAELDPNLKVYVEYSNEVWNWGFPQSQYALQQARDRWGKNEKGEYYSDGWMQFHGMKTAQICEAWEQELGSDRVVCVLGLQTGWKGLEEPALDCPLYVAEGNDPCWQHIDALGVTGYFSGNLNKKDNVNTVLSWLDNEDPNYAIAKAFQQLEFGDVAELQSNSNPKNDSVAAVQESFEYYQNVAKNKNLDVVWYEGGTHFNSSGNDRVDRFLTEVAQHEKMYDLYLKLFKTWQDSGGQLINMWGGVGTNSPWAFKDSLQDTDHPKWRAMMDFIAQNPCWWDGCRPGTGVSQTPDSEETPNSPDLANFDWDTLYNLVSLWVEKGFLDESVLDHIDKIKLDPNFISSNLSQLSLLTSLQELENFDFSQISFLKDFTQPNFPKSGWNLEDFDLSQISNLGNIFQPSVELSKPSEDFNLSQIPNLGNVFQPSFKLSKPNFEPLQSFSTKLQKTSDSDRDFYALTTPQPEPLSRTIQQQDFDRFVPAENSDRNLPETQASIPNIRNSHLQAIASTKSAADSIPEPNVTLALLSLGIVTFLGLRRHHR
ncbi:MAG: hypothetical protein SAJ12_14420 [Jaaginema sp. PMC 1079.18]|nr:hypothetical protein [Jaaginema sp. PMC 1080.18]MEC4852179.1 hypothetical protein [Jaaginema sp. PMC 1079.18]MEC4864928.1 hypothetical protein [Jaaginema sp. PMC 1078.18]